MLHALALPLVLCWQSPVTGAEDPLPAADPAITRAELEHHVRFLASDELGGRAPLTPGMERAAQYLARGLAAAGAEPAGEQGTYFQATGLKRFDYPAPPRVLFTDESGATVEAVYGQDFFMKVRGSARGTEKLPLRFFYDYNHSRMPLTGDAKEAIYFSGSKTDKRRILKEKGIANLDDWGLEIELLAIDRNDPGRPREVADSRFETEAKPEACELIELRGPLVADFERRRFTHVQLLVEERQAPFEDRNVVGRIRGVGTAEQPELAQETIVLSAHYDHLGSKAAPRGRQREDSLYNGADDDASGCATLLELAQAFGLSQEKPARTLVFLFTTGEETGGKGCARYIAAPAEPLEKTVANFNFEMLGRPDELVGGHGKLWITGSERTNLGYAWQDIGVVGLRPDPRPEEQFYQRSDNFAFALEGIVAHSFSSFGLHKDYHTPRDEADTLDYPHLEAATRLAYQASAAVATGQLKPFWIDGQRPTKKRPKPKNLEKPPSERAAEKEERRLERKLSEDGDEPSPEDDEPEDEPKD